MIAPYLHTVFYLLSHAIERTETMRDSIHLWPNGQKYSEYEQLLILYTLCEVQWSETYDVSLLADDRFSPIIGFFNNSFRAQIKLCQNQMVAFKDDVDASLLNQQRGHLTHVLNHGGNQLRNVRNLLKYFPMDLS